MTPKQIQTILDGIKNGFTIEECCNNLLNISRYHFYYNATKEQKEIVRKQKLLCLPNIFDKYKMTKRIKKYNVPNQTIILNPTRK